jgi:SAM-dependent methyltransferase
VAAEIIEHLDDTDAFLEELDRILAPGGLAIVTTPNLAFWLNRVRLFFGKVPWSYPGVSRRHKESATIDLNHLRVGTAREWISLFRTHGLELVARSSYRLQLPQPGGITPRVRDLIDALLSRFPELAFGMIFGLRKPGPARDGL